MPNPNPKTDHLLKQNPNWLHLPTKAIRVPEVFADKLLALAHQWDEREENRQLTCKTSNPHRWLGIDPGLATVRWAVLEGEVDYQLPRLVDHGTISTAKKRPTPERLLELEQDARNFNAGVSPRECGFGDADYYQ